MEATAAEERLLALFQANHVVRVGVVTNSRRIGTRTAVVALFIIAFVAQTQDRQRCSRMQLLL